MPIRQIPNSLPGGTILREKTNQRECCKFLDQRLNTENESIERLTFNCRSIILCYRWLLTVLYTSFESRSAQFQKMLGLSQQMHKGLILDHTGLAMISNSSLPPSTTKRQETSWRWYNLSLALHAISVRTDCGTRDDSTRFTKNRQGCHLSVSCPQH